MIIKHHANKNDYCLSRSGHWIRDFTKSVVKPIDINDMSPLDDLKLILDNEFKNNLRRYQTMELSFHEKAIIIGDGYGFEESVKAIEELSSDVIVIGVNKAFSRWKSPRMLNYYVVNNPYQDCLYYYPQLITSWPKCVASIRTYPNFLEVYKGLLCVYSPTCGEIYSGPYNDNDFLIDDYRNSICAAVNLCYKFKVKKLMLMSTLETYQEERAGTIPIKDGLWTYPQQKVAHDLIDANLYWMQKAKIDVGYTNSGLDYEFATYINVADLKRFFNDGQKR